MADIFVSYARQDKARVAPIVAALERQGWSVWWDPAIVPGQEFDDRIAAEIGQARAVVVVWTPASVASRWVRGEAREAADRGIVIPVRFDAARLPLDARAVHTTELDDWGGNPHHAAFQEVVAALSALLGSAARSSAPLQSDRQTSICVLPFVNMSGDPEQEYFSDGLSEELLNHLAQIKGLKVAARTSSFAFKGQNPDIRAVSQKLGVGHVLEGSVRKAGNRLRITAQLISCADGYHLWSNTFNRELDDVFQIQDDIARAVADALKVALGIDESILEKGGTRSIAAYDAYLRARALVSQWGPHQFQRAIALYRSAVELDPKFALAWAGLGGTYGTITLRMPEDTQSSLQELDAAFAQVTTLAPNSALAKLCEAFRRTCHRDWLGTEAAYAAAASLTTAGPFNELSGTGVPYAFHLSNAGRLADAVREASVARSTDPLSLAVSQSVQYMLDGAGRYDEAEQEFQRSLEITGDHTLPNWWALLRSWARADPPHVIRERMQRHISDGPDVMPFYPEVLDIADDRDRALAVIRSAFAHPACQDQIRLGILAHWAARYGDTEVALAAFRRAFVELGGFTIGNIWFPVQRETRRLPGFKDLVRDLGLPNYWRTTGKWGDFARPVGADDFQIIR
jgi:adenylate cyclase